MGDEIMSINLAGLQVTVYAVLAAAFTAACAAFFCLRAPRRGVSRGAACVCAALALVLGGLLGRAVYCAVRAEWLFYDEIGNFAGLAAFFDPAVGGMSVAGVVPGCVLAAFLAAALTRVPAARLTDALAAPAVLLFALMRFIEPLCGQGYGELVESPALCVFPLALENEFGEWSLSVCFIEGMLALALFVALYAVGRRARRAGTLALCALTLLSASQVLPDSLRRDDVLFIFIFARVPQIMWAVSLCGCMAVALARGARSAKAWAGYGALTLLGVALLIGAEFALDKTNLPDLAVYAVMLATLAAMAFIIIKRVFREDVCAP